MSIELVTYNTGKTPASLLPNIERKVYGNQRGQMNRLTALIDADDTTLTFDFDLGGIRPGAIVELDDEAMFVWETDTVAKTAVVQRGHLGTDAAAHAPGEVARVEPRFLRDEMMEEIATEIRSWPTGVYARHVGSLLWGSGTTVLDVGSSAPGLAIVRVQRSPESSLDQTWLRVDPVRLERRQDPLSFSSGYSLVMPSRGEAGRTVQVTLRSTFDTELLTSNLDFGFLGISPDLVDIIPWGVASRMLASRDVARTDASAQGRSRPAEEVRTGEAVNVARALMDVRDRLLRDAANRLLSEDGMGAA